MEYKIKQEVNAPEVSFPLTPEALWKLFFPRVMVYLGAFKGLSHEDREELASDSLLKAWQGRASVKRDSDCRAWIFTIARRTAIDRLRSSGRSLRLEHVELDAHEDHRTMAPERELLNREEAAFVRDFLDGLSDANRELAFLYYYENMTVEETARLLKKPVGTVKWMLYEIRNDLRRRWEHAYEQ